VLRLGSAICSVLPKEKVYIMNYYKENRSKKLIIENLDSVILNKNREYDVYFITLTFQDRFNSPSKDILREYLKAFSQNMNTKAMNRRTKNHHKSCILICLPEKSHKGKNNSKKKHINSKLSYVDHYHGFLLIHKDNKDRFFRRAVENTYVDYYKELQKNITVVRLKEKLLNNVRCQGEGYAEVQGVSMTQIKCPPRLHAYNIDLRYLETKEDIKKTCQYMFKKFQYSDFSYDDVEIFSSLKISCQNEASIHFMK
jgi:hypothetical protein